MGRLLEGKFETIRLQGGDPMDVGKENSRVTAWLWFEFEIIAMAAGWYEGIGPKSRGEARPPLCHYRKDGSD